MLLFSYGKPEFFSLFFKFLLTIWQTQYIHTYLDLSNVHPVACIQLYLRFTLYLALYKVHPVFSFI